jgi:hypothetical protein
MSLYQNPSLFNESVSAVTATNTVDLGTIRWEGGNRYKYVYMEQSAQVGYFVNHASNSSGYTVTASMTTGDMVAGVVQNTTLTTATYGWILKQGIGKIQTGANSIIVTNKAVCVAGSGTAIDWVSAETASALSAATYWNIIGRSIGSGTASGVSILMAINCL